MKIDDVRESVLEFTYYLRRIRSIFGDQKFAIVAKRRGQLLQDIDGSYKKFSILVYGQSNDIQLATSDFVVKLIRE